MATKVFSKIFNFQKKSANGSLILILIFFQFLQFSHLRSHAGTSPATNSDIAIYQAMGTSFFCMAGLDGVHFPKALGIAASTYAQALKGRHRGKVQSLRGKRLNDKEMFAAAEQQILLRAMKACPKAIPYDIQLKVRAALENRDSGGSSNRRTRPQNTNTATARPNLPTIQDTPFELIDPSLQELMRGTPFQWKK